MTAERLQALKRLFDQAQSVAPGQRLEWLSHAAPGDDELQREAAVLLAADAASGDFLETPPWTDAGAALEERMMPQRIGPYSVQRVLGRGGMGVVLLASRDDAAYRKNVAIKIVSGGMDPGLRQRFQHERQILATLDHPNIARLLDGGALADGSPYLVMEYVDGEPITVYCDRHRMGISARLTLFQTVCAAVHHAHINLIIHRDLKPANILITRDGVPKLLDFGIAKLLAGPDMTVDMTLTAAGFQPMTPDYASPEQVRAERLTTAADTYALGLILYELMCGSRPQAIQSASRTEIERAILHHAPPRPSAVALRRGREAAESRATTPEKLQRSLAGDIDNIVGMATRKEPERRYGSAVALADDIGRHLAHFPVAARRDTFGYRAAAFVQRNARLVAAATLALTSLSALSGVALWQARVARHERAVAERRFLEARQFAGSLLAGLFHSGEQGIAALRHDSTQRTVAYLEKLAAESPGDSQMQVDLAEAYRYMGVTRTDPMRSSTGDLAGGLAEYQKAARILEGLAAAAPGNLNVASGLARTYEARGLALLSSDVASSLADHQRQVAWSERIVSAQPTDAASNLNLAVAIRLMGERLGHPYYGNVGDTAGALREVERAAKMQEQWLPKAPHDDPGYVEAGRYTGPILAGMAFATGDLQRAISLQYRGIAAYTDGSATGRTDLQAELGLLHCRMSLFFREAGRDDEARASVQQAIAILEPLYRNDPASLAFGRNLTRAYNQAGDVWLAANPHRALDWYDAARRRSETWLKTHPGDPEARERLAESFAGAARSFAGIGDSQSAEAKGRQAVGIAQSLVKLDPRNAHYGFSLVLAHRYRGDALRKLGRRDAADEYRKALALVEPMAATDPASWLKRRELMELKALVAAK